MKICVIEPHADDAFLSLGYHIEKIWPSQGHKVAVLTVFSDTRKRGRDAADYCRAVGAKWYGVGLTEHDDIVTPENIAVSLPVADVYYIPFGVAHTEHYAVTRAVRECLREGEIRYYLDQPYYATMKNQADLCKRLQEQGFLLETIITPHARKFRHVPLFRDQSKFFHFNPPEKLGKIPEITVKKTTNEDTLL